MKKAFRMILMYFVFILIGFLIGEFFYALYEDVTRFVSGTEFVLFNGESLVRISFFVLECVLILICPIMIFYRIRHTGGVLQLVAFIILGVLTWGAFMPLTIQLEDVYSRRHPLSLEKPDLTSGYFRKAGKNVYFFTNDSKTVKIDLSQEGIVEVVDQTDSEVSDLYSEATPYRDVLIHDAFEDGSSLKSFVNFDLLVFRCKRAFHQGFLSYLCFISIGFVLCSIFAFSNFFDWKLINSCALMFLTSVVLFVNGAYFLPGFSKLIDQISNFSFFRMLSQYMDAPFLCLLNVIFGLIFIVVGIIRFGTRRHAANRE